MPSRDAVGVHSEADAFHVRQNARQRQFHLGQQPVLPLFVKMPGQRVAQRGQHPGVGVAFAGKLRRNAVLGRQRRDLIIAG